MLSAEIVQMESAMRTSLLVGLLLVSYGLGAPLSDVQSLDKRRESTPEILNLEQQLKKAAGEDKQYFSGAEGRPMIQIDGLATNEQDEGNPTTGEQDPPDYVVDGIPAGEEQQPDRIKSYGQLWNFVRQHPEYMEEILQDYVGNTGDYDSSKSQDLSRLSYPAVDEQFPADNDVEDAYMASDADDRSDALMADYLASSEPRHQFARPDDVSAEEGAGMTNEGKEELNKDDDDDEEDIDDDDDDEVDDDDVNDRPDDDDDEDDEEDDDDDDDGDDDADNGEKDTDDIDDGDDYDDEDADDESEENNGMNDGDDDGESDKIDDQEENHVPDEVENDEGKEGDDSAELELEGAMQSIKAKSTPGQRRGSRKPWQDIGDVVVPPVM